MDRRDRRDRREGVPVLALALVAVLAGVAPRASAGVLETSDDDASLVFTNILPPQAFFACCAHDFSLMMWVRRTNGAVGQVFQVVSVGTTLHVEFDDAAEGLRVRLVGEPADIDVLVPLRNAEARPALPVDEWILVACRWEAGPRQLTAWAQSESVERVSASATDPRWERTGPAWPPTIGRTGGGTSFTGQFGLMVVRSDLIEESDLDAIWNDGAAHYFAPALLETASMSGLDGVRWMIGHGVVTQPVDFPNPSAEGAEIGDAVTVDNLLIHTPATGIWNGGFVDGVVGAWTIRSPHEPGEPWSGFFERQPTDLGLPRPLYVESVSPRAKLLADDTPEGLIRVITSGNSRNVRLVNTYGMWENWAHGGLYESRKSSVAGVNVPAWRLETTCWPAFCGLARRVGDVASTADTARSSVAFGNFGSHGVNFNGNFPEYELVGLALVVEDGSALVPKARPEPGTLFGDVATPLTVRAMLLAFPGSGDVVHRGEKAVDQHGASFTSAGDAVTESLDTTVVHVLAGPAAVSPRDRTLTLAGPRPEIEVGHGCYIDTGPGLGGISIVVDVDTSVQDETTVTLERWFPTDPVPGASGLRFGPVEPHWASHAWPGLAADDPEVYRGLRLTASGGPIVVLFMECHRPGVDGFVIGGVGKSGLGYTPQLDRLFSETGVPYMKGLAADVWLQFIAHQNSSTSAMSDYTARLQADSPATEIWWIGDPDYEVNGGGSSGANWETYILQNAGADGVGALLPREHPSVGMGNERQVDGHSATPGHLTGRGALIYLDAALDMMKTAALPLAPCPADSDGNRVVDVVDLVGLLGAWGTPDPTYDIAPRGGDGVVDVADLAAMIVAWGPCD